MSDTFNHPKYGEVVPAITDRSVALTDLKYRKSSKSGSLVKVYACGKVGIPPRGWLHLLPMLNEPTTGFNRPLLGLQVGCCVWIVTKHGARFCKVFCDLEVVQELS